MRGCRSSLFFLCASLMASIAVGQSDKTARSDDGKNSEMAAKVDGSMITVHDVQREFSIAFANREIAKEAQDELRARTLEQLICRRLVHRWLVESKQNASDSEVESAVSQLKKRLEQRGGTLEEFLSRQHLDGPGLRRSLAWQIAWQRYLDKELTDTNLEKYFVKRTRDFDGTELRVAHILFHVEDPRDAKSVDAAKAKAAKVLEEIRAGKTTFAKAVTTHSSSPSRDQNGDIGFITRHAPMPESFSRAAFRLETGQISEPVVSSFGVHLIQCVEIKPGKTPWTEVRAELEQAVTQFLFEWAANQVRSKARIEYSPSFPHFRPGTEILEGSSGP